MEIKNIATAANLKRKAEWADGLQLRDGIPLPSWVEINAGELCNRTCVFCPRVDPIAYPNQALFMPVALAEKIGGELRAMDYEGAVTFCGYSEPLLVPYLTDLIRAFRGLHVELVTSGDRLTAAKAAELYDAGLSFIAVSLYDGPHQYERFHQVFAGIDPKRYALRDRWHGADENFGLGLTNRAGTVMAGEQKPVDPNHPCFYPSYCLMADWDGRVLLCPQDWHKKVSFGNLSHQSIWDIWTSRAMNKRRDQLTRGRTGLSPCEGCNSNGCAHGSEHVAAWRNAG